MECRACKKCGSSGPCYVSNPTVCKECVKSRARENRNAKIDYYRAYDRLRFYESGPRGEPSNDAKKRRSKNWTSKNAVKRAAHIAVKNAIRCGVMERPSACEECGWEGKVHGHHDDYSRPLDVRW